MSANIEPVCHSQIHKVERIDVPGGWLYTVIAVGPTGGVAAHATFVPYPAGYRPPAELTFSLPPFPGLENSPTPVPDAEGGA